MNSFAKYGLIAAAIGGFYLYNNLNPSSSTDYAANDIDLNAVLDITLDTLYTYEEAIDGQLEIDRNPDTAFTGFADELAVNYNKAQPAIYEKAISVAPRSDASLLAYNDSNNNLQQDETEDSLFLIEIDGEQSRIIATSRSGAVNDHHFSGTSLLAGYLIGSMLSRQRAAGVSSSALANKKPVTSGQAARARAGSGSHSKGK